MKLRLTLLTLLAAGCSGSNVMNHNEVKVERTESAGLNAAVPAPDATTANGSALPSFDRDAALILSSGKYETATFALG